MPNKEESKDTTLISSFPNVTMHKHRVVSATSYHNMIKALAGHQHDVSARLDRSTSSNIGRDKSFVAFSNGE
jgi:hypothetical protein